MSATVRGNGIAVVRVRYYSKAESTGDARLVNTSRYEVGKIFDLAIALTAVL